MQYYWNTRLIESANQRTFLIYPRKLTRSCFGDCRFQWAQKVPSMVHAVTMTVTGVNVVLQAHRAGHDLLHGRNELVAAFLGLELAYLLQVSIYLAPCKPGLSLLAQVYAESVA